MGFFSRLMGGSDKQATATSEFEILAPVSGELVNLEKPMTPLLAAVQWVMALPWFPKRERYALLFPAPSPHCFRLSTRWASCPMTALLR